MEPGIADCVFLCARSLCLLWYPALMLCFGALHFDSARGFLFMSTSTFVSRFLSLSSVVRSRSLRVCRATLLLPAAFLVALAMPAAQAQTVTFNGQQIVLPTPGLANGAGAGCTTMPLCSPNGVVVNSVGDVYVADSSNNRVVELPAGGAASIVLPVSVSGLGLSYPTGLALDSSNNLYIADNGHNRVVEVTPGGTDTVVTISITPALNAPYGLAVDSSNNLYIADSNNNRVVEVPLGGGTQTTVGAGFSGPRGVAVDAAGNVYVADTGNNQMVKVPVGCTIAGCQVSVSTGVGSYPGGVAVNAAGTDVYIAVTGSNNVVEVPWNGSSFGTPTPVGSGLSAPAAVALDTAGDVFIANTTANQVVEIAQNVNFGSVAVGASPSPTLKLTYTFTSAGTLTSLSVTTRGATGKDFTVVPAGTTCTAGSYAVGKTCTVEVQFAPSHPGSILGGVQLVGSSGVFATTYMWGLATSPFGVFAPGMQSIVPINITGGLNHPVGVVTDGNGNLYIADCGNNRVVEVTSGGTASVALSLSYSPHGLAMDGVGDLYIGNVAGSGQGVEKVPASLLPGGSGGGTVTYPYNAGSAKVDSVAVDGAGNLYATDDSNNDRVVKITPGGALTSLPTNPPPGNMCNPESVAVDGLGDVYYTDISPGCSPPIAEELTPSGVLTPMSTTSLGNRVYSEIVDAAGDVYFTDTTNSRVVVMPAGWTSTTSWIPVQITVPPPATNCGSGAPSSLCNPSGVAVDGAGTLYIADTGNNRVIEISQATQQTLNFSPPSYVQGTTSPQQTVTVQNIGNETLDFAAPAPSTTTTGQPSPGDFTLNSGTCTSSTTLAPGVSATCDLGIEFTPLVGGTLTGFANITDDNLNVVGATQSVVLNGTATGLPPTLSQITPNTGSTAGGTPVTITGTNLTGATAVNFGNAVVSSSNFTVNQGGTTITLNTPASPLPAPGSGSVNITVTTPSGTSSNNPAITFTYVVPPTITPLSPSSSPTWGNVLVTINGSNFGSSASAISVMFGSVAGTSVNIVSPTQITVYAPAESAGTVPVTVTVGGVASNPSSEPFNYYQALTVTSVNPSTEPAGTPGIVITGQGFQGPLPGCSNPNPVLSFGGIVVSPANFVVNSATQITATSPATGSGTVDVTVSESNCSGATSPANPGDKYTYGTPTTTTTTLSVTPSSPASAGQQVTVTATVTASGSPVASGGTVTFYNNGTTVLGTESVNSGQAIFSSSTLPVGTYSLTATYTPSSNYAGSKTSTPTPYTITGPATTTAITVTPPGSASYGSPVQISAQVLLNNGVGATSGNVTFSDSVNGGPTTILGTVALTSTSNGVATFSTSTLPMGSNSLTASFGGNSSYGPSSTKQAVTINITAAPTTTSLNVFPPNGANYGQQVTLTATVTTVNGSPVASGNVNFYNNGSLIGTAPVTNGTATFTTTALPSGGYSLTASYPTQGNYIGSQPSAPMTGTVVGNATQTTLQANPTTQGTGGNVTLTATVTSSGSLVASGTVTFQNNGVQIGSGTVTNGVAMFSTNNLPVGANKITASYGAGGSYGGSTSSTVTVNISATPAGANFTLTANPATVTVTRPGTTGTTTLTLTPINGYSGTVNLSCQNMPYSAACSFTQSGATSSSVTLSGGGPVNVTLTIQTNVAAMQTMPSPFGPDYSPANPSSPLSPILPALAFWWPGSMAGLAAFGRKRNLSKARQRVLQLCLLVLMTGALAAGISGCAGGTYGAITPNGTTPSLVVASPITGGGTTQTAALSIVVQ